MYHDPIYIFNQKLDLIIGLLRQIKGVDMALSDDVTELQNDLTTLTTAVTNAVNGLSSLAAQIATLKGQVADPATVAALETALKGIEDQTTALSNATPAPA